VTLAGPWLTPEIKSPSSAGRSGLLERWGFALALVLVIATVVLYHSVKSYPFITLDDRDYVTRNFQIQSGVSWDTVQWAFTSFYSSNWHPLTWLSHAFDCQLFHLDPAGHHDTNVLFHALNAALLFWVLWRATGFAGRSFMVAALFALHPINVESVAWVSERKNLLSLFFFLLALGIYRWYALKPRLDRYLAVAALYALGLMAKPQIITFPCVLLLWDYWPLQRMFAPANKLSATAPTMAAPARSFRWLLVEKLPLFLLSAASAVLTIKAQRSTGALGDAFTSYPFAVRLENAIVSYVRYIGKTVWPSRLAVFYPHPEALLNPWQVAGAAIVLVTITALCIGGRRHRYFLVGWLWFLGTLVPMIGLVQVGTQGMADRYAYLPVIGLFLLICWGVADVLPSPGATGSSHTEAWRTSEPWLTVGCLGVLLALAVVAHRQLWHWRNSVALWEHAAEVTRSNWMAEDFLGELMMELRKPDQAVAHFRRALAINPDDPISNVNIGNWNQYVGKPREAIENYKKVLHSARAPEVLRTAATQGLQRADRDLGIVDTSGVTPEQQ
jgi:tetratricopeptide (TPR) repeat protein